MPEVRYRFRGKYGETMTDNLIDIVVWIMWTIFIAAAGFFIGFDAGFQEGYIAAMDDCILALEGVLA